MLHHFARLFSILTTIEREFGLTSMEKGEREVFDFIVSSVAEGKAPCAEDVVRAGITSRATAYRRLAALTQAGLVRQEIFGGQTVYQLGDHLAGFGAALKRIEPGLNLSKGS